jgi:hypothetical protein
LKPFPPGLRDELEPVFREIVTDNHGNSFPTYDPWVLQSIQNHRDESGAELVVAVFESGPHEVAAVLDPRDYQEVMAEELDADSNTSKLTDLAFLISIFVQENLAFWRPGGDYPTNEVRIRPRPSRPPT